MSENRLVDFGYHDGKLEQLSQVIRLAEHLIVLYAVAKGIDAKILDPDMDDRAIDLETPKKAIKFLHAFNAKFLRWLLLYVLIVWLVEQHGCCPYTPESDDRILT